MLARVCEQLATYCRTERLQVHPARLPSAAGHRTGQQRTTDPHRRGAARPPGPAHHPRLRHRLPRRHGPPLPDTSSTDGGRPPGRRVPARHRDEWEEFEEHFDKRKVELGTCGRPYGTPCAHEHACIRCPMLASTRRMLPRPRDRSRPDQSPRPRRARRLARRDRGHRPDPAAACARSRPAPTSSHAARSSLGCLACGPAEPSKGTDRPDTEPEPPRRVRIRSA